MRIFNQSDVLDQNFRAQVISEIKQQANESRKREALKRQECYRDNTIKHVMKSLKELGLKHDTLNIMQNHASNISIVKKVINKKARSYRGQVMRSAGDDTLSTQVMSLAASLGLNDQLKKADAITELQNNSTLFILPEQTPEGRVRLRATVLGPWQYDVIEDARNPERAACVILSEFVDEQTQRSFNSSQVQALDAESTVVGDQIIAQGSGITEMKKGETFIWWTDSYHFTTDEGGVIINSISPEGLRNPIDMMPMVSIDKNQDGNYWGSGGQDLVDGAILVNVMATDMNAIMYMQGWGQLVISGPNIPTEYHVGPHTALVLETREGQSAPNVELISSNPPIDSWLKVIEQYVALLLSTNDLSTSAVSMRLDASSFPSGIAMLVDKSEAVGSIEDRRQSFAKAERRIWKIVGAWSQLFGNAGKLDGEFAEIGAIPMDLEVSVRFQGEEQIVTEKEKLEILKMRKEMGLVSQLDLIMADNPNMTREEAESKLAEIKAAVQVVAETMTKTAAGMIDNQSEETENESETSDVETEVPATAIDGGGAGVQRLALNGAQVSSLVEIIVGIQRGEIPKESARGMIATAFPFLGQPDIDRIIRPTEEGSLSEPGPA